MDKARNAVEKPCYERSLEEVSHLLDIPVKISVQIADRNMKVRDVLQLQKKSVVEFPKSAGENVDILMNGRLVAFGEVLELEGAAGIRITDINAIK
ncbi:MAG TPA: FliM/FliN family flagellar motor switch protein [Acidobacteriota bacterium]|nr:FliM/FliN family flagellar motor switch protein [Acidobacteriota bacterium]